MDEESRTPLGELLVTWRRQRGLTQRDLADRTIELARHDDTIAPVSSRTILSLERPVGAAGPMRRPRRDTAHSLAVALGLQPGSPSYRAFMEAAQRPAVEAVSPGGRQPRPSPDVIEAGREHQLHRLAQALDAAARGRPTALVVRGEPGSGKTTLIAHACRLALVRHADAVVLWASANADDQPHGAFIRVIRQMLGDADAIASGQDISAANREGITARASLAAQALATEGPLLVATSLAPADAEGQAIARMPDRQVADRLSQLAATAPDDGMRTVSGCEQFFRVIGRYAEAGPVVLVMDDLHDADPATLASLDHLLNRIHRRRQLPIAIILASLPDGQSGRSSVELSHLVEGVQRRFTHGTIDLGATQGGTAARAFAEAALARAALPSDVETVNALIARTGGNPLIVTSLVDALRDRRETAQNLASAIEETVPPSLARSLAGRIGRLPEDLQRIVVNASVLGAYFYAETLMRMLDLPPERFIDLVDHNLWRRHGLMRAEGTSVIGGRVIHRYRFQPPILRDAVYRTLSALERTHAHGRAADALRDLHGEANHDRLDRLAHHLERAGRRDEAARAYLQAGELARTRREFDNARNLLERVGQLGTRTTDPATWARSRISLGLCERADGNPATARTHVTRALDLASTLADETVSAAALEALGMLDFDAGDMAQGRDRILRAVDIWARHDSPETGRALANLSYTLYGLGRYSEAIDAAERARLESTRTRQTASWIDGTIALANCWIDLGHYDRATELHEHALMTSTELGDLHRQRISWINLALLAVERGDWGAAELAIDHVASDDDPVSPAMEGVVAFHCGLIAEGRGNRAVARDHFTTARELRDRNGQAALAIDAVAGELRIALAAGERDVTATLLDDLERRLDERGSDGIDGVEHPGRLYATLIEASLALGRHERAREHARLGIDFLTARSAHVPDAGRESYLWGVGAHRRILELAASLGAVAG